MQKVNVFAITTETDPDDPEGYRAGAIKLAPIIGGKEIGGSIYDLPPGLVRRAGGVEYYDGE